MRLEVAQQIGIGLKRTRIADGEAHGAVAMGLGSRMLARMARNHPHFITAVRQAIGAALIPVSAALRVSGQGGELLRAVNISGDSFKTDEVTATAGSEAACCRAGPSA